MNESMGRILFRLTRSALIVANTGRPFSLHGLIAIVYGWTSTKGRERLEWPEEDREFLDESDAQRVIDERREAKRAHLEDPYELNSQSSQQSQTVQSYSGRTLFELLQNAVDANSDRPIGYKGVGFRSVLNITSSPEIHSGPLHVEWSSAIAEETVGAAAKNLPVLAFPKWSENRPKELGEYDTVVVLPLSQNKREEIEKEWSDFLSDPSIVVFVSGLSQLTWDRDESIVSWERREEEDDLVSIVQTQGTESTPALRWKTCNSGSSRVAIPVDESGRLIRTDDAAPSMLRCFFPTEDPNPFEHILIHAEFSLAPDRKHVDARHPATEVAIKDAASAIGKIASTRSDLDDVLDLLALRSEAPLDEESPAGGICAQVRRTISGQKLNALGGKTLSSLRSCPRSFRQKNLSDATRLELWEIFKGCIFSHLQEGLEDLPFYPCGTENLEREKTLVWLESKAPLSLSEVQKLNWAKCESITKPCTSKSLFAPPSGKTAFPTIPDEIELRFLDRALHADLAKQLGYSSKWFLPDVLGVAEFDLEKVVTTSVFPVLKSGAPSEAILPFLRDLWLADPDEKKKEFNWSEKWKATLSRVCAVRCKRDEWHPAIEVYAGIEWTGKDFLEQCYGDQCGRYFLHTPAGGEVEVEEWSRFYRWLGVGWAPKVLPLVLEEEKFQGWRWNGKSFDFPFETEPEAWKAYCSSAWAARYQSESFVHRRPRLKTDWTLDGSFSLLELPGAFQSFKDSWSYFQQYAKSSCGWSSNQQEDYDNERKTSSSYLFWRLNRIEWVPLPNEDLKRRPLDCFRKGEVASSRALAHLISRLPEDFPERMSSDLEIRASFDDLGLEDWRRWISSLQGWDPTNEFGQRDAIRRFYSCVLANSNSDQEVAPFHELNLWWMERLEDRENWILAPSTDFIGFYLDRPEFEALRLRSLFVFPARLDEKAKKALYLFGIPKLSEKLTGRPLYGQAWPLNAIKERVDSRSEFIVSYLGLNRRESGQAKLASDLEKIEFKRTDRLSVEWVLDGERLDSQPTECFISQSEGLWTLISTCTPSPTDSDPVWEKVAEAVLLASGSSSTDRSANLRDILTFPKERLKEKLTSLGVAPESIEDAKLAVLDEADFEAIGTLPGNVVRPDNDHRPSTPRSEKTVPDRPFETQREGVQAPPAMPLTSARPHPELGIPAQEKLRDQLEERYGPEGWTVRSEVPDDEIGTRTDIVLEHPEIGQFYIEAKNLNARQIYWSERQVEMSRSKGRHYCIALVIEDGQTVRWIFDPLISLKTLSRKVVWNWRARPTEGEFDDSWRPTESPPMGEADSYKAVVTIPPSFRDALPEGIEHLATMLSLESGPASVSRQLLD